MQPAGEECNEDTKSKEFLKVVISLKKSARKSSNSFLSAIGRGLAGLLPLEPVATLINFERSRYALEGGAARAAGGGGLGETAADSGAPLPAAPVSGGRTAVS